MASKAAKKGVREAGSRSLRPVFFASLLFLAAVVGLVVLCIRYTGGNFAYALDDAYIHLSIAKNLVEHGVWGNTQVEFQGAASSILWPLLNAALFAMRFLGDYVPLVLAAISGVALLFAVDRWWSSSDVPVNLRTFLLCLLVLVFPLPALTLAGMEHTLHAVLTIALIAGLANALSTGKKLSLPLLFVAAACTATRYEAGMLILIGVSVLLYKKRFADAGALAVAGILAPAIYAFISVSHGGLLVPNSVYTKSTFPRSANEVLELLIKPIQALDEGATRMFVLQAALVMILLAIGARQKLGDAHRWTLGFSAAVIIGHLFFGTFGWIQRYEAYLYALTFAFLTPPVFAVVRQIEPWKRGLGWRLGMIFIAAFLGVHAIKRIGKGALDAYWGPRNINDQQVQMAVLVKEAFPNGTIALNDIGAVSYYTNAKIVDFAGLGSSEIARLIRSRTLNREAVTRITTREGVEAALVYDDWFPVHIPRHWERVGEMRIQNNRVCGSDRVAMYAVTPGAKERLRSAILKTSNRARIQVILANP
jgi:hypothetical protein